MARPKGGYKLEDGTRVPGVTTIAGAYGNSAGLVHAAWKLGADGKDYRKEWYERAAGVGTLAHEMIEAWLLKKDLAVLDTGELSPADIARSEQCLDSFKRWWAMQRFAAEELECSSVSPLGFGGTIDLLARSDRGVAVIDFKTGSDIYPKEIVQLSAYRHLAEHRLGEPVGEIHLLRIGREHADFHHHSYPESVIDIGWEQFKRLLECYRAEAELKKLAK